MAAKNHNQYVEALKESMLREAEAIIMEHPMMTVSGTAFDAGSNNASVTPQAVGMEDDHAPTLTPRRIVKLDGSVNELSLNPKKSPSILGTLNVPGAPPLASSGLGGSSNAKFELILKKATPLKASGMWSTSMAATMWFNELTHRYRFERLRKKLERHLLPLVMQRRLKSVLVSDVPAEGTVAADTDANDQPTGAILAQCCPWLAALNDKDFLDEVASSMQRLRKLTGDDVVKAGDPSQGVLYLLQTGKYEWVTPATHHHGEKLQAPAVIGDTFGGPTRYERSLYARSKCSIWYISKSSVDAILSNWVRQLTLELYSVQSREEMRRTLRTNFPLDASRIALLRRMPENLVSTYFSSFEPIVLTKGTVLFEEGTNAGTVTIVCDGILNRSRKAHGDDQGFSQFITIRAADGGATPKAAFSTSLHRFALFGEEPHILPEKHRFTCTVYSDVLKGYRIPARVFTSMLLDDPTLLLQLRQDILLQRAKMMRIKPEALKQVPILADVPIQRLHTLVQVMVPRVYERSQFLCQSQQALRDIYLVIRGDVRDPRTPGVVPPVLPPAKLSAAAAAAAQATAAQPPQQSPSAGTGGAGNHNASFHMNVGNRDLSETIGSLGGTAMANLSFMGSMSRFTTVGNATRAVGSLSRAGSLYTPNHPTVGSGLPNEISLPEDQDLSPPIPMGVETKILHALGGGWEGLLQEKWQRSWEAVNVVEVWVLPTAAIRNEYNEISRNLQASILATARVNQMKDLQLDSIPNTKLPPMSFYRSGTQTGGAGGLSDGESARRMSSRGRKSGVRGKPQFRLGAAAVTESSDSTLFDMESMTESINLDQNPRSQPRTQRRSRDALTKSQRGPAMDEQRDTDHEEGSAGLDDAKQVAAKTVHKPQPPAKALSPSSKPSAKTKAVKGSDKKKSPALSEADRKGSYSMFEDDDQMALMRKFAQERNERQQLLRSLPLEEVIKRETKRMARGDHRLLTLPPLMTREDVMYFHGGDENAVDPARKPSVKQAQQAVALTMPESTTDDELMQRRQLLFGGHERLDAETGLMEQDRVIRVPKPPSSAVTASLPLPPASARPLKKPLWDDAASPLPSGLMLMLKHNGSGAGASKSALLRSASPTKVTSARAAPAVPSQASSPRAVVSAAVKERRWFQHIPDSAPSMKCSNLDRKFQGTEPFDVMLVQMLRMAEDAGVIKQPSGAALRPPRL